MEGGEVRKRKLATEEAPALPPVAEEETTKDNPDSSLYLIVDILDSNSPHAAAIYEAKIQIRGGRVVVTKKGLDLLATLYERKGRKIPMVACGALRSTLYLFAPEMDPNGPGYVASLPCSFNMETKEIGEPAEPKVPKSYPLVMAVNNTLYVLSDCPTFSREIVSEPSFESFDPATRSWKSLSRAPFHTRPFSGEIVTGYAVFGNYILVSLQPLNHDEIAFFSYKVGGSASDTWKPVYTTKDVRYHPFNGKVEVIEDVIYVYLEYTFLIAYELLEDSEDYLSLAPPVTLQGVEFQDPPEKLGGTTSEAMARIGNGLLCLVHTGFGMSLSCQHVCIAIVQVLGRLCIKTVSSSVCTLDTTGFDRVTISSCFVRQPEDFAIMEHRGHGRGKHAAQDNDDVALGAEM